MISAIVLGLALGILIYLWETSVELHRYWESKKVPHVKPWPLLGNSKLFSSPSQLYLQLYNAFPDSGVIGLYEFGKKKLLLRDPQIINKVLIKNFNNFIDRGVGVAEEVSEVDSGLFTLRGAAWRAVRAKTTPMFSSGRLKAMFPQLVDCAANLISFLDLRKDVDVETRGLMFVYTTDVIATTAFGIDAGTMRDPDSQFRKMAMKSFHFDFKRFVSLLILSNLPILSRILRITFTPREVGRFFAKIIKDTLAERKKSGTVRNDFVQLLLELKEEGSVRWTPPDPDDDYLGTEPPPPETFELTDCVLTSQAFTFLSAGSEPVANSLTFALLELSKEQEAQARARGEVDSLLQDHGGFTYEAVRRMTYLEQCVNETLRMYPVAQQLLRKCTEATKLDGNLVVERGTEVVVPVGALHRDPALYPLPEQFSPERFLSAPPKGAYLPFGQGPRMCIAMRFAIIEMKVALAALLHRYRVVQSPKTKAVIMNKWSFFTVPSHDVYLTFVDIHSDGCSKCITKAPPHHCT